MYLEDIRAYAPQSEQEEADRRIILAWAERLGDAVLTRESESAHLTASGLVLNGSRTKVLMARHDLYRVWAWTGGHADGDPDLLAVALREAREETGLVHVAPVFPEIFSLETLWVEGHEKRGKYVPCHLHLNVTYLLEADAGDALRAKPDENSGVRWFMLDEAVEASTEEWMRARVYEKLNRKVRALG